MIGTRSIHVHLLPTLAPSVALNGGLAIVVDVLRATTVMLRAIEAGCTGIRPCLEIDEARALASSLPGGTTLLAGERQGLPIEGFDLGNSPGSFTPSACAGKTLVMTTTNGTRAILASHNADRVLIGSFGNLRATAREAARASTSVYIVCSGTDGRISWEDSLLAGALVLGIEAEAQAEMMRANDEAEIVASLWTDGAADPADGLGSRLARGRGGRRVTELGLGADIAEAARVDWSETVLELRRDPLQIVRRG